MHCKQNVYKRTIGLNTSTKMANIISASSDSSTSDAAETSSNESIWNGLENSESDPNLASDSDSDGKNSDSNGVSDSVVEEENHSDSNNEIFAHDGLILLADGEYLMLPNVQLPC